MSRTATIRRDTRETQIELTLGLDGTGQSRVSTGVGFFDHMLELWSRHGLFDLTVKATGDLHVDAHHTVEDVGICLGQAVKAALGDKAGVRRYGSLTLPMDEALVTAAVDLSGRAFLAWRVDVPRELLGAFHSSLGEEFWRAVATQAGVTLHVVGHAGTNTHHVLEAVFKATARAFREACEPDPRAAGAIPSTKGRLSE